MHGTTDAELRRGDVRIRATPAKYSVAIEVWDGASWVALRGARKVSWSLGGPQTLSRMELTVDNVIVDLLMPNERVALNILQSTKESNDA